MTAAPNILAGGRWRQSEDSGALGLFLGIRFVRGQGGSRCLQERHSLRHGAEGLHQLGAAIAHGHQRSRSPSSQIVMPAAVARARRALRVMWRNPVVLRKAKSAFQRPQRSQGF